MNSMEAVSSRKRVGNWTEPVDMVTVQTCSAHTTHFWEYVQGRIGIREVLTQPPISVV